MKLAIPREVLEGERRVALAPDMVKRLGGDGVTVRVEQGAGAAAGLPDDAYREAGAEIVGDVAALLGDADVVLKIHMPRIRPDSGRHEADLMREGAILIGLLQPATDPDAVRKLAQRRVTAFSLDALPRISRAQSMDVLSSMSTVAGYKAVLLAASRLGKLFPMMVTAAGTIRPAKVLVLGAGVAGLQAIATSRRLGAVVEAFDVRPAVQEQVESLGAKFLASEAVVQQAEAASGYAQELSEEQHERELELIHQHISDADVVITTALIPGKPAPELITEAMVRDMKPGSVIVDLAAEQGGNCAFTKKGGEVSEGGVTILGPVNVPSTVPKDASQMFSRNAATFLRSMLDNGQVKLDFEDEVIAATCITRDGEIVHEMARQTAGGGAS